MKYLEPQIADRIEEKLKKLNSLRPLPPSVVAKLKQQFAIEMTYNSNAIEGNSLTLKETGWVIQDGLTIKGKPLKDHLEAKDHYAAINYLYEVIEHGSEHSISEVFIRNLHKMVVRETEQEEAGSYRKTNVIITGSDHKPVEASEVSSAMDDFIVWVRNNQKKLHSIELAAIVHHKIVYIHPFTDGNGRTARLTMNLFLMHEGYPLVVVLKNDRRKYYRTLAKADKGEYSSFVRFIAQAVERSLNIYLRILVPTQIQGQKFVPLSEMSTLTPYSEKYLNFLARYGKIEAHKEKRMWVTTKEAIDRYMKDRKRIRIMK
jgi:Fic family protein